ncbi:MAG TPA: universal stress protein [Tepidisphaeraceae bacterium]|nr:universal stress protein [Tepidisphaeraceae bacterium]
MSRILVAVSSQWAANRLIEPVANLAKTMNASVVVTHVSRPSGGQQREQEQAEGELAVKSLAERLDGRGIKTETVILFADDIPRAILDIADERQVSLIMLGLTGRGIFSRLIAGNVPVELIRETKVPVLLVPPDWDKVV